MTLSHQGYVKYQPLTDYEAQRRGGKGKSAARIKEEDFIDAYWWLIHTILFCVSQVVVACTG
ncbi:DNA gyrase C-terminal beta-propeller domain-containing protein [Proteus mirabilis]